MELQLYICNYIIICNFRLCGVTFHIVLFFIWILYKHKYVIGLLNTIVHGNVFSNPMLPWAYVSPYIYFLGLSELDICAWFHPSPYLVYNGLHKLMMVTGESWWIIYSVNPKNKFFFFLPPSFINLYPFSVS